MLYATDGRSNHEREQSLPLSAKPETRSVHIVILMRFFGQFTMLSRYAFLGSSQCYPNALFWPVHNVILMRFLGQFTMLSRYAFLGSSRPLVKSLTTTAMFFPPHFKCTTYNFKITLGHSWKCPVIEELTSTKQTHTRLTYHVFGRELSEYAVIYNAQTLLWPAY